MSFWGCWALKQSNTKKEQVEEALSPRKSSKQKTTANFSRTPALAFA